jgi:hypothetical protein
MKFEIGHRVSVAGRGMATVVANEVGFGTLPDDVAVRQYDVRLDAPRISSMTGQPTMSPIRVTEDMLK